MNGIGTSNQEKYFKEIQATETFKCVSPFKMKFQTIKPKDPSKPYNY